MKSINLSEEEKEKTRQYGDEQYKNLPEHKKERLVEYKISCLKIQKRALK